MSIGLGRARVEAELADFSPSAVTVQVVQAALDAVRGSPALPWYGTLVEAADLLHSGASGAVIESAERLLDEPAIDEALAAARSLDESERGASVMSTVRSALSTFLASGGPTPDLQRADAVVKLHVLAFLLTRLFPEPDLRADLISSVAAARNLLRYYAAVEIALPFGSEASQERFVATMAHEQAPRVANKLLGMIGRAGLDQATAWLPTLLQAIDDEVSAIVPHAATLRSRLEEVLPSGLAGSGHAPWRVATGQDALPAYRWLVARLATEASLERAARDPSAAAAPVPEAANPFASSLPSNGGGSPLAALEGAPPPLPTDAFAAAVTPFGTPPPVPGSPRTPASQDVPPTDLASAPPPSTNPFLPPLQVPSPPTAAPPAPSNPFAGPAAAPDRVAAAEPASPPPVDDAHQPDAAWADGVASLETPEAALDVQDQAAPADDPDPDQRFDRGFDRAFDLGFGGDGSGARMAADAALEADNPFLAPPPHDAPQDPPGAASGALAEIATEAVENPFALPAHAPPPLPEPSASAPMTPAEPASNPFVAVGPPGALEDPFADDPPPAAQQGHPFAPPAATPTVVQATPEIGEERVPSTTASPSAFAPVDPFRLPAATAAAVVAPAENEAAEIATDRPVVAVELGQPTNPFSLEELPEDADPTDEFTAAVAPVSPSPAPADGAYIPLPQGAARREVAAGSADAPPTPPPTVTPTWPTVELPEDERLRGAYVSTDGRWRIFSKEGIFTDYPPASAPTDWDAHWTTGHVVALYRRRGNHATIEYFDAVPESFTVEREAYALKINGETWRRTDYDLSDRTMDGTWSQDDGTVLELDHKGAISLGSRSGSYRLGAGRIHVTWQDSTSEVWSFFSTLAPSSRHPSHLWLGGVQYTLQA